MCQSTGISVIVSARNLPMLFSPLYICNEILRNQQNVCVHLLNKKTIRVMLTVLGLHMTVQGLTVADVGLISFFGVCSCLSFEGSVLMF